MSSLRRSLALLSALVLAALACGMSVDLGLQQPSGLDRVSTMVAKTLAAYTQVALSATPTYTPSPTVTPTKTPSPVTLSVSAATDCFAGPSTNYGFVITIHPGTVVTVIGKDAADNYWIINVPGYPGTICWLSGQYAKLTGDAASLPDPATPLASNYTLSEPRNLRVSCSSEPLSDDGDDWWHHASEWSVVFRWTNTEPDQTGVRVYRDGRQIATLGPHASTYTETFMHRDKHRDVTYGVQAFTGSAVSSIVTVDVRHCD